MQLLVLLLIVIALGVAASVALHLAISVLWALIIGAIVGAVANWIVGYFRPGGGPQGLLETALAGIAGSFLATLLLGRYHGLLASVLGAVVVVFLWKAATTGRYPTRA